MVRSAALALVLLVARITAAEPVIAPSTRQLIVVTSDGWRADHASLQRWERAPGGAFRAVGPAVPVVVGSTGMGWGAGEDEAVTSGPPRGAKEPQKREGDARAPAGIFAFDGAFGDQGAAPAGTRIVFRETTPTLLCVDDPASLDYNRIVDSAQAKPHTSAEHLRVRSGVYALGLVIAHNAAHTAERGSCVFMHIWDAKERPTVGCTAMTRSAIEALIGWLDPAAQPRLVQLPSSVYRVRRASWGLP